MTPTERQKGEDDQIAQDRQPMRCRCGSVKFTATFQVWADASFELTAGSLSPVTPVSVNSGEMHSDWITHVACDSCGLVLHPQDNGRLEDLSGDDPVRIDDEAMHDLFNFVSEQASEFNYAGLGIEWQF